MNKLLRTCTDFMTGRLRSFAKDRRGNFGIMLGLSALPLIGLSGLALDYGAALTTKARMDSAADAAALSAVMETVSVLQQQQSSGASMNFQTAKTAGEKKGNSFFQPTGGTKASQNTTVAQSSTAITATVTYSLDVPTNIGGMFGVKTIPVSGKRVASQKFQTITKYAQIIFLVDISGSMAFAGNDTDEGKILSTVNCLFACHESAGKIVDSRTGNNLTNFYGIIRTKYPDMKLKIDYVQDAVKSFMSKVNAATLGSSNMVEVGINAFGSAFATLQPPTSSQSAINNATSQLIIEDVSQIVAQPKYGGHWGFTNTSAALRQTAQNLVNVGNGSSASFRDTYVVLVTDGIEDNYDVPNDDRSFGEFYQPKNAVGTTACDAVKNKGATLIVIGVPYPQSGIDTDPGVKAVQPDMIPALQRCASPGGNYIQADNGDAIAKAGQKIFLQVTQSSSGTGPVLTQ